MGEKGLLKLVKNAMSARKKEGEKLEVDKEAVGSKKIKELQEMSVKLQNEKREETNSKLATKEHAEKPPKDATDGASDAAGGSTSEVKAPSYSCYVFAQTEFTSLQQLTEHSEARHSDGRTTQSKKSEKIGGVPEKLEECPKCKEVCTFNLFCPIISCTSSIIPLCWFCSLIVAHR